jgi:hypothetical protein
LTEKECVEVFLISGSFEERKEYAGDVLKNQNASIVLCSMQYTEEVNSTIEYVVQTGFDIYVQWLNPGYTDARDYFDRLGLVNLLLSKKAVVSMRDGQIDPRSRVQEIKEFIYGWASYRQLLKSY